MRSYRYKQGFSLVEVLVATTILLVIMVLVSMVFQQQSGAFQAGRDRISGQSSLRNVMGIIERDLTLAVDSSEYPGLPDNVFQKEEMGFVTTAGIPNKSYTGEDLTAGTSLQYVTYEIDGNFLKREVFDIVSKDGRYSRQSRKDGGEQKPMIINSLEADKLVFDYLPENYSTSTHGFLPDAVRISASVSADGSAAIVSGHCLGPDGRNDTKDDIYVGGKPNE